MTDTLLRIDPHYVHGLLVGVAIGVLLGAAAVGYIVAWWCAQLERERGDGDRIRPPRTLSDVAFDTAFEELGPRSDASVVVLHHVRKDGQPVAPPLTSVVLAFLRPRSVHPPEDN